MKNNIKKAPVKIWEDLLYFQHFMLIFVFAQVIITTFRQNLKIEIMGEFSQHENIFLQLFAKFDIDISHLFLKYVLDALNLEIT